MAGDRMSTAFRYSIDVFAIFNNRLRLSGWVHDENPVVRIELVGPGIDEGRVSVKSYGLASPDVQTAHGETAKSARFDEMIDIDIRRFSVSDTKLIAFYAGGNFRTIENLGRPANQRAAMLTRSFHTMISGRPVGTLLEVGSRARSGVTRRTLVPQGWRYTGLDVMAGPNVDVVGDAHELSRLFPSERFDAVMSFSVLEHLLMPWKFVIELNRVLNDGAVGIFTTHQCWPLHDQPWDFWRFSDRAWTALLNRETGFEILEASMGEPAFVVAQRCHAVTNFGTRQGGFLASNVLFRKIADTTLSWPVQLDRILSTEYPAGEISKKPN